MVQAVRKVPPPCLGTWAILVTDSPPVPLAFLTGRTFESRFRVSRVPTPFERWSTKRASARFRSTEPPRAAERCSSLISDLAEMARIGADEGLEVSLFVGPREEFGVGGAVRSPDGLLLSGRLRGYHQLRYALEDIQRAVEAGIRGFLIADTGLMEILRDMVSAGELPRNIVWKISAVLAPSNPVTFRQLITLGGTTVNVPSDVTLAELAELRSLSDAPIDLYLESPDSLGGVVRGHELGEIALVAAPLYAKFGLRNARAVYPAGEHLRADVVANVQREGASRAD